ncbi:MAG: S8 family peptidase [Candidatus Aminicenantes bacterium]|nr:S8 family peptidase [Candidatus Aminicenantes bacterium]
MRKNKPFFLLSIIFIFLFSSDFDRTRLSKNKRQNNRQFQVRLQSINDDQPFHLKEQRYAPDQVLVKFKPMVSDFHIKTTISAYKAGTIKKMRRSNIYQLQLPEYLTVEEMVWALERNPDVEYACPNYIVYITAVREPNDTFFDYQYALRNTGQDIGIPGSPHGKDRADIKALEGWEETEGSEDIIIAVIDTGIDFGHPDLEDKTISNGYDFANDDEDPTDDEGHGTFIAGIAAAKTNNNEGVAGVAWDCKILPIKAISDDGTGYVSWLIDAIYHAVDNGADVINMSLGFALGPDEAVPSLEDALQYAHSQDVVCVASAGNDGEPVLYPAAYDEFCLAVAATDFDDLRPTWSNYGPEVDVAAPGVRIVGCVPTWYWGEGSIPYGFLGGTSTSVPHVVGMVALIKSIKSWLSADEIMDVIRFSADDTNTGEYPGKDDFIGYGRINMEKALVPIKITK